jgi:hypothetical protein
MVTSATSVPLPVHGVSPLVALWELLSPAKTFIRSTIMLASMTPPRATWTHAMSTLVYLGGGVESEVMTE